MIININIINSSSSTSPADEDGELLSQQIGKVNKGHLRLAIVWVEKPSGWVDGF